MKGFIILCESYYETKGKNHRLCFNFDILPKKEPGEKVAK